MESNMKKYATILVTGGAGYIGRHVVKALMSAGHFPVVLDNSLPPRMPAITGAVRIDGRIEDARLLSSLFTQYDFDAVVHLAAYPGAMESGIDPIKYHQNNFSGTLVLVESMLNYGIKRFIFSSTAAVYGDSEYTPMDENHPCRPNTRHGESKYFVEKVLQDCSLTHGLKYIALRLFSVTGNNPRHADGLSDRRHADIITGTLDAAAGLTRSFNIFGTDYNTNDGTCIRDYVHVTDVAAAYVAALGRLMNGARSAVYNVGTGRGHSVRQVVEEVQAVTGRPVTIEPLARRPGDAAVLIADPTRSQSELGWQARFKDLEEIIRSSWAWHQKRIVPN
jgi:UDP-glucose 4-epimerase